MSKSNVIVLHKSSLEDVIASRNLPYDERIPFVVVYYKDRFFEIYVWYQLIEVDLSYEQLVKGYKVACMYFNDLFYLEEQVELADASNCMRIAF